MVEASSHPHSQTEIFFSSGGMAFVALTCAVSGYSFSINRIISLQDVPKLILIGSYVSFVFAYLYCRYAALEGPVPSSEQLRNSARFVPLLLVVGLLLIFLQDIFLLIPPNERFALVLAEFVALCPFVYLGVRMYRNAVQGGQLAVQGRQFKNKVLIPAFATCLISFAFGWTLVHPTFPFTRIAIPSLLIIGGRRFLSGRRWQWAVLFISVTILISSFLQMMDNAGVGSVVLIGTILTLAMGVAEVCKRVVRIDQGHPGFGVVTPPETRDFYLAGANWSSAVFPLFLFLLPLLVPGVPVLLVFLIVATQFLHWHFLDRQRRPELVAGINILVAFSLPLMFAIHPFFRGTHALNFVGRFDLGHLLEWTGAFWAAYFGGLGIAWRRKIPIFVRSIGATNAYLSADNSFLLFVLIDFLFFMFTAFVALINDTGVQYFQPKAKEILVALVALVVLATICKIAKDGLPAFVSKEPVSRSDDQNPGSRSSMVGMLIALLIYSGRAPFAVAAGLPVIVLLARHGAVTIAEALFASIPIMATTMGGFILNDVFDAEGDRNSLRYKPLAKRVISFRVAICCVVILFLIAMLCALPTERNNSVMTIMCALLGVSAYSPLVHRVPTVKGFLTAILSCSSILYAAQLANLSVPLSCYAALFVFVLGRELLLDVQDLQRDRLAGMKTLVAYIGVSVSRAVGWAAMIVSVLIVMVKASGLTLVFDLGALLTLMVCIFVYGRRERDGLHLSGAAFLLAAVGVSFAI